MDSNIKKKSSNSIQSHPHQLHNRPKHEINKNNAQKGQYNHESPVKAKGNVMNLFSTFMEELEDNYKKRNSSQPSPQNGPLPSPKIEEEIKNIPKHIPKQESPQVKRTTVKKEEPKPLKQS